MQSQNEEFSDQETPTAATEDRDLMRQLMAEVAEMRKENQQLKSEVAKIKTQPRRQLFKRSKDCDPECSVSKVILFLTAKFESAEGLNKERDATGIAV